MVRTINVVFTDKKVGRIKLNGMKQYRFLCYHDSIQVGDIIKDTRYLTHMQVVSCNECSCDKCTAPVQDGITLKTIEPYKLNGVKVKCVLPLNGSDFDIDKQRNSMEARNISVTVEQAREWYNSGNPTLRTLALNAYAKSELVGYEYMRSCVEKETFGLTIPRSDASKVRTNSKLAIIAKYLNGSWEMSAGKTGYFIGKSSMGGSSVIAQVDLTNGIAIYEHKTVQYAGIVYFKNAADAKEAAQMLGVEIWCLF